MVQAFLSRRARCSGLVLALTFSLVSCMAHTEPLETMGSFKHPRGEIRLLTASCRPGTGIGQQAVQDLAAGGRRQGCWGVNRAGDPVISWADGAEQVLDGNRVRLAPRFAALIQEPPAAPPPAPPPSPAQQPERPPAAAEDFTRPGWCARAGFPHERLVCADRELATRDLQLAQAWRDLRPQLSRNQRDRIPRDYFQRLKRCGADKACVTREQLAQLRRYETRQDLRAASGSPAR